MASPGRPAAGLMGLLEIFASPARSLAVAINRGHAARVADRYWQQTTRTHAREDPEVFAFYHRQILALISPAEDDRIADYGCGEGSIALALKSDGYTVVGADLSRRLVEICRGKGLECALAAEFLAAPDQFEIVIVNNAFFYVHPRNRGSLLRALRAKVVAGGRLFILDEPDIRKRGKVSSNPVKRAVWLLLPVYHSASAAFFDDLDATGRIAIRCGFRAFTTLDSWSDYRSHLVIEG